MFAKNLKRIREEKNLSKYKLSLLSGIDTKALRLYERGDRQPILGTMITLARSLNCTLDCLTK